MITTCNVYRPGSLAQRLAIVTKAAEKADVLLLQEVTADLAKALDTMRGWTFYAPTPPGRQGPGTNAVGWRDHLTPLRQTHQNILKAGAGKHVGAKWATAVTLRNTNTATVFTVVSTHLPMGAFTKYLWKRGIWRKSLTTLTNWLHTLPAGPVIVGGDFNNPGAFKLEGFTEVQSPPTHGRKRLDRFFIGPAVTKTVTTGSDHKALILQLG